MRWDEHEFSTLVLTEKYNHTSSQSQKHSAVTSQTQISVIQSQNHQLSVVPPIGEQHKSRIRILRILLFLQIHEFYWILKMPSEFYFEIQCHNSDWKVTIPLLQSHRNTQQRQVRLKSVLFRVKISNSPLFPFNSCSNIVHSLNVFQFNHKNINNHQKTEFA